MTPARVVVVVVVVERRALLVDEKEVGVEDARALADLRRRHTRTTPSLESGARSTESRPGIFASWEAALVATLLIDE